MWQVDNRTPFAAQGYFVRDRTGAEHWTLALRARFVVRPDGLVAVADEQKPVRLAPDYVAEDALELAAESDFAPFRPRVDLTVSGIACAPGRAPVERLEARVTVGSFEKRALIHGERRARQGRDGLRLEAREPFEGIALAWAHALGGPDATDAEAEPHPYNPVGMGWVSSWGRLAQGAEIRLPQIENPDARVLPDRAPPTPHGFGPLQPAWRPRGDFAGTYDDAWRKRRAPLPPEDFSERFHQAAPEDQILDIRGGEPVSIEGLHPEGPYAFRLPQVLLETTTRMGRQAVDSRLRLIAVGVDATAKTVDMVWNAHVRCTGRDVDVEGGVVSVRQMAGVAR